MVDGPPQPADEDSTDAKQHRGAWKQVGDRLLARYKQHRRAWQGVGVGLLALGLLVLLLACVLWIPRWLYPALTDSDLKDVRTAENQPDAAKVQELKGARLKLQNDARTTLLQGLGAVLVLIGAGIGANVTLRGVRTTRDQIRETATASRNQLKLSEQGQITDRYTKAVDQLGSEHLDVRVGGIYALQRIARDSPDDRATIEEVLTAFVRVHAPWPVPPSIPSLQAITLLLVAFAQRQHLALRRRAAKRTAEQDLQRPNEPGAAEPQGPPADMQAAEPQGPPADVQAAVTVLGRRLLPPAGASARPLDLAGVDLRNAWLGEANLEGARLTGANLQGARLEDAHLRDAYLREADLQDAVLLRADLRDAWLPDSNLQGARLDHAFLQGARLDHANLQDAQLERAKLQKTQLINANLQGARLWHAELQCALLFGANLQNVQFGGAKLEGAQLGRANLQGAELSLADLRGACATESTRWPEGWTRKAAEDRGVEWVNYQEEAECCGPPTDPTDR